MKKNSEPLFLYICAVLAALSCAGHKDYISDESSESSSVMETKAVVQDSFFANIDFKKYLNYSDKVAACQIPSDLLHKLDTKSLFKICSEYPLLVDVFAFDTIEHGWNVVIDRFNGYKELLSRNGFYPIVLQHLSELVDNLVNYNILSDDLKGETTLSICIWEQFLSMECARKVATEDDIVRLRDLLNEVSFCLDRINDNSYLTTFHKYIEFIWSPIQTKSVVHGGYLYNLGSPLFTPNGSEITDCWTTTASFSSSEKKKIKNSINSFYPNAVIVGDPDPQYNCHFYAWMGPSFTPKEWLGLIGDGHTEDVFWTDGSYTETTAVAGAIVSYQMDDHSAIVYNSNYFVSKWGQSCVVRHLPADCPYIANSYKYYELTMRMSGPTSVFRTAPGVYANETFNVSNPSANATYTWSVDEYASVVSGQGTSQATIRFKGPSQVSVVAHCLSKSYNVGLSFVSVESNFPATWGTRLLVGFPLDQGAYVLEAMTNHPEAVFSWQILDYNTYMTTTGAYFRSLTYFDDVPFNITPNIYNEIVFTQPGSYLITVGGTNLYGTEWNNVVINYDGFSASIN